MQKKWNRFLKRALACVLVVVMTLTAVPMSEIELKAKGADDSINNYIAIENIEDLKKIQNNLNGNYVLVNDLDLSSCDDFITIGTENHPFTGSFDGNGHTISNLTVSPNPEYDLSNYYAIGFFNYTTNATIKNIKLINIDFNVKNDIVNTEDAHFLTVGGIVGVASNSTIFNCCTSGSIFSSAEKGSFVRVAGIVASADESSIINCYSSCNLFGSAAKQNTMVGGIVAWLYSTNIEKCYFSGSINAGCDTSYTYCGGISASGNSASNVKSCFVLTKDMNAVSIEDGLHFNCISNFANQSNNYVLDGALGTIDQNTCKTITEEQATNRFTYFFSGWDFNNIWKSGEKYPDLRLISNYSFDEQQKVLYSKDMSILYAYSSENQSTEFIVPESVNTIKSYAFYDCKNLKYISIYKTVTKIDDNAIYPSFSGVINIDSPYSVAHLYVLEEGFEFTISEPEKDSQEVTYLDYSKTAYDATSRTVLASGIISFKIIYSFKEDAENAVSDMKLKIYLPSTDNVVENSVIVNGSKTRYTVDDRILIVDLNRYSGDVTFSIVPFKTGTVQSYAQIEYSASEERKSENIGFVTLDTNTLSIDIPDEISGNSLIIKGTAQAENEVKIYVDGVEYTTCMSNKLGKYSVKIMLPSNKDSFIIEARETDLDGKVSSVKACTTNTQAKIQYAYMYYRGRKYNLMSLSRPNISWARYDEVTFEIKFKNSFLISGVYISTDYNGTTYVLRAKYDKARDIFVAKGFSHIIPGSIKIKCKSKNGEYIIDTDADIKKIAEESVSDKMKNSEVKIQNNTFKEDSQTGIIEATIQPSGGTWEPIEYSFIKTQEKNPDITPSNYADNGYTEIKRDDGTKAYVKIIEDTKTGKVKFDSWDYANDVADVAYHSVLDADFNLLDIGDDSFAAGVANVVDFSLDFIEFGGKMYNVSKLKKQIMDSPLSSQEKATRVKELDYIANRYYMISALKMTSSVVIMDAAFITVGAALGPIGAIMMLGIGLANNIFWKYMDNWADQWFQNNVSSLLNVQYRYIIDPSGYVYEAVKDNRLTDVKTTIYYKDEETGEAVLWDASEYEQENPLYTDTEGKYAWDVPVGYWLVKCEKDGYLTAYSDWLPVPPPQLDINIAMVSTQAPIVEYINVDNNGAEICFSQYMDPNTVNDTTIDISCGEKIVSGTWSTVDSQPDANDSEKVYATTYRFEADSELSGTVSVSVNGAANYAGRTLEESFTEDYTVQEAIESFHVPESVVCEYGKNAEIKLSAQPVSAAKGKTVNVSLEDTNIATLNAQSVVFDENGEAVISVKSNLPGSTAITFNVDKTHFSAETELISNMPEDDEEITDISIKALPTKLDYLTGDRIDTDGIVVTATYGDGTEIEMNEGLAFYPSKLINIGETEITVSLGELTDTFIVNVTCNHDYLSEITLPTCTEDGYTTYTCSACGDTYQDDIVMALGHTEVIDPAVAATCTETGLTQGSHCSVCGEVLTAQKEISALGHTYGEYAVTIQPTCTKAGVETKTCSVCGDKQTRPVAALGHTDTNADGNCDNCGEIMEAVKTCSHMCHKGGFSGFIWKLINLFNKLFRTNKTCSCGVNHY